MIPPGNSGSLSKATLFTIVFPKSTGVTISVPVPEEEVGFIPVRYVKTENEKDDKFKLARKTEWLEIGDNYFSGVGQRVLSAGEKDFPLLDIRSLLALQ